MTARTIDRTAAPSGVRDVDPVPARRPSASDRRLMAAAALSAVVLVGFAINRTTGMPGALDDIGNWAEPLGMISLLVEAAVVWLGARAWSARD
jgi:hypothetical protein